MAGPVRSVGVFTTAETFGDAIYKVVFLRALRAAFPGASITWMTTGRTLYAHELASVAAPLLDRVVEGCGVGDRPAEMLRPVPQGLGPFDLLIDTQSLFWRTASCWRLPHRRFLSAMFLRKGEAGPHVLDRLFALLRRGLGAEPPPRDLSPLPLPPAFHQAAEQALPAGPRYLAIAPGAGGVQKRWPLERFLAVAAARPDLMPAFLLGPAEAAWRAEILAALPAAVFPQDHPAFLPLGGPQPMAAIALAGRCAAGLANDSGTGHMIAASGAPLLSLFGPSNADKFRPVAARLTVLRASQFGGREMTLIPAAAVSEALAALLPA